MFYAIQCALYMIVCFALGAYALYADNLSAGMFFVTLGQINLTGLFIIGACRK